MGMLLLQSRRSSHVELVSRVHVHGGVNKKKELLFQIMEVMIEMKNADLQVGFMYARKTPTSKEVQQLQVIFQDSAVIMGDMNLDPRREDDLVKLNDLCGFKRVRVLHENTFNQFNQLDHVFLNRDRSENSYSTSYINHSSDHRTITLRIPVDKSSFSKSFLQAMHFDKDHWTRKYKPALNRGDEEEEEEEQDVDLSEPSSIDKYLELLRNRFSKKALIFDLGFSQEYLHSDFEDLQPKYKDFSIVDADCVIIPYHVTGEDFRVYLSAVFIWKKDRNTCQVIEPYQFGDKRQIETREESHSIFINRYAADLHKSFNIALPNIRTTFAKFPSDLHVEIKHRWVYLLATLRSYLLGEEFDAASIDVAKSQQLLEKELRYQKILNIKKKVNEERNERKRLHSPDKHENKRQKSNIFDVSRVGVEGVRRFYNKDGVTCWLNSCLQAVLNVLDHYEGSFETRKSELLEMLLWLQHKDSSSTKDGYIIKELLYATECQRILEHKVTSVCRLFHFAGTSAETFSELKAETIESINLQQDSKDFFYCLSANSRRWFDVYSLFKIITEPFVKCQHCESISRGAATTECFLEFEECPTDTTAADTISRYFSRSIELVESWKCGECQQFGGLRNRRMHNVAEIQFLVVIFRRLKATNTGQFKINKARLEVGGNLPLTDASGTTVQMEPIAVVHYQGRVVNNDTTGHYRADILEKETGLWLRTSDDQEPIIIDKPSDQGYILVYKKSC